MAVEEFAVQDQDSTLAQLQEGFSKLNFPSEDHPDLDEEMKTRPAVDRKIRKHFSFSDAAMVSVLEGSPGEWIDNQCNQDF